MNVKDYRKQIESEVQAAAKSAMKYGDVARKPALDDASAGPPMDSVQQSAGAEIADALTVAQDREKSPDIRVAALRSLTRAGRNEVKFIDLLLALAKDRTETVALRHGVLRILRQLRFSSHLLNEKRADYIETLRSIIDDESAALREDVLETLALEKDEYAQRRLIQSLTAKAPLLVPLDKTVQFLGYDIHGEHFPMLREIAREAPEPSARREAVRLLSADPGSVGVLREVFQDKQEQQEVRRAGASGLLALDPVSFEQEAKQALFDPTEDEEVRAACLSALTNYAHPAALDGELQGYVDRLEKQQLPANLETAVKTYQRRQGHE